MTTQNIFPLLDTLEHHGLRQAYLILMFGARSWNRFQNLHDNAIPETCRLPREYLIALKKETGVFRTKQSCAGISDELLLDEFEKARRGHTLHAFYCSIIVALSLPPDKKREGSPPDAGPHHYNTWIRPGGGVLHGQWNSFPTRVNVSWYFFADMDYSIHVEIDIDTGTKLLTPDRMRKIVEAPRHPSFFFCFSTEKEGHVHFSMFYALPASDLFECECKYPHYKQCERQESVFLTTDGDKKLVDLLSKLGMTDILI